VKKQTFKERVKSKLQEVKRDLKKKAVAIFFLALAGFFFWVLVQILFYFYGFSLLDWFKGIPYISTAFAHIYSEIKLKSFLGIFYSFGIYSLFFLPVPLELFYINFLRQEFGVLGLFLLTMFGVIVGQIINYSLGRFFGFLFLHFIKKKTKRKIQEKLDKYSSYAVLLAHILPFPFQIFNVIAGALRFKFTKWFMFMVLGLAIHFAAVSAIYLVFF